MRTYWDDFHAKHPVRVTYSNGDTAYLGVDYAVELIASDVAHKREYRDAIEARLSAGEAIVRRTGTCYQLPLPKREAIA